MANLYYDSAESVRAWRERRRRHVGASEAAAVCGLSPYATALSVWLDKVQPADGDDEPTERMRWGLLLEPAIARGYELATGRRLVLADHYAHGRYPFMAASPDRAIDAENGLVQLKNVGRPDAAGWGEPGTDEVPRHVLLQCQQEMECAQADFCDVAALFGGCELRVYRVEHSPQIIEDLAGILGEFWRLVEARTPPEPDWLHPTTPALLDRLHRPRAGVEVELAAELEQFARFYQMAGELIRDHTARRDEFKARLIHAMGDAGRARCGGFLITRREIERQGYTVGPTTYTDFRVKAPKPEGDEP